MASLEQALPAPRKGAYPWPDLPYKGLNFYLASDASLFGERQSETEACAAIVGAASTKLLLIHGRSGTGKSSFLRAGLLPRLAAQDGNFLFLRRLDSTTETYLVRCTDDPVLRLRNALRVALDGDPGMEALPTKVRSLAMELLSDPDLSDRRKTARGVYNALRHITGNLASTLVICIDQSEEVITLGEKIIDNEHRKAAFFQLLEELCFRRIDIRLIIALRTEYYGQFCDHFKVGPTLSVAPVRNGLEQFMLHGLQDHASLRAAIYRPTSLHAFEPYGVPHDKYQFEYMEGVIDEIVEGILGHCGESSTLPVMQLICSALHRRAIIDEKRSVITIADYREAGGVEGTIETFIDSSLRKGIEAVSRKKSSPRDLGRWKDVIATLVVRQEGGALTTLLLPRHELEALARKAGIRIDAGRVMDMFSADHIRLLRKISALDARRSAVDRFSLGHDALAHTLLQWRETREKVEEQRRRSRRLVVANGAVVAGLLIFCGLIFTNSLLLRGQAVHALGSYANAESTKNSRLRLLLLLGAWSNADSWAGQYLPFVKSLLHYTETRNEVVTALEQAPVVMRVAKSVGIAVDGQSLAMLEEDGEVRVATLTASKTNELQVNDRSVGRLPPPDNESQSSFVTIGFLNHIPNPVVYRNGVLYVFDKQTPNKVDLSGIVPDLFNSNNPPWGDLTGGVLRLQLWDAKQGTIRISDVVFVPERGDFENGGLRALPAFGAWPTFSDFSPNYLRTQLAPNNASVFLGFGLKLAGETTPLNEKPVDQIPLEDRKALEQQSPGVPSGFVHSLAFANADKAVAIRLSQTSFSVVTGLDGQKPWKLTALIPDAMARGAPVRPQWTIARPVLAVTNAPNGWRLAWLTMDGILVLDVPPTGKSSVGHQVTPPLMPSVTQFDAISKLRFSMDGRSLISVESKFGANAELRIYDLSGDRKGYLEGLTDLELRAEACRVAGEHEDSNQLTDNEKSTWPQVGTDQPCPK